ncbi:MAG: isoleucine--tRNA ligase [Candidatus Aenigmatarchaeota archaeon]
MNYDHKHIETIVEKLWKKEKENIKKSIMNHKKRPLFSFLEGPPTANAPPGLHHLEVRVFKDLVCRYKYMKGFRVPRKGGWDCHGLPIEVQVEKNLGLESKKDVVKYGIAKFNKKCRENVFSRIDDWTRFTEKSAFWIDLENPYVTLTNDYIESVWWALSELFNKGLLYEAHKVVPYCPRCETPLSLHEVAQGYKKITMESITLKFQSKKDPNLYFLAWTTTPWTLPSNLALAVHPDITYVFVKKGNNTFVVSKGRLEHYFPENPEIVKEVKGKELEGIEYVPLFDYFVDKLDKPAWRIILAGFVTETDGTGIVHIAPAFGETDYESSKENNLPFVQPVEKDGTFTKDVKDWEGRFVIDADPGITEKLNTYGKIFSAESYTHDYPYCWRCKSPLLYYAMKSWFIAVSKFREQLAEINQKINWFPDYIKEGRFGNWIIEARDWALSRSKFWGTPLPIWRCNSCGKDECIGSIEELKKKAVNFPKELDLHKPEIDELMIKCECGKTMQRLPEVIDTWFDSGSATFAQFHYPFENKETFKKAFPYDFIAEAIDQTRGWFYTLHVLGVLLFNKPAYKSVVCAGHILDDRGEKMSKSRGNVIDPWEMFNRFGIDASRLAMCTSAPGNMKRFGPETIKETVMPFLNILWNSYLFSKELSKGKHGELEPEDEWIISRNNTLITEVENAMENHDYHIALSKIEDFVVYDLSRWYIKLARERTDDVAVQYALAQVFENLSKIIAPLMPYFADFIWTDLLENEGSVHFEQWPKPNKKELKPKLEEQMQTVKRVVEASNALRQEKGIKLRYPLLSITVSGEEKITKAAKQLEKVLARMANVKMVKIGKAVLKYEVKPNYAVAGKKFGKDVKELAKLLEKQDAMIIKKDIEKKKVKMGKFELTKEDLVFKELKGKLEGRHFPGGVVSIDTRVSDELKQEWLVRELIRAVQDARKKLKLSIKDSITLYLPDEKAFKKQEDIIKKTTGSRILYKEPEGKKFEFKFEREKYVFGVRK